MKQKHCVHFVYYPLTIVGSSATVPRMLLHTDIDGPVTLTFHNLKPGIMQEHCVKEPTPYIISNGKYYKLSNIPDLFSFPGIGSGGVQRVGGKDCVSITSTIHEKVVYFGLDVVTVLPPKV